MANQVSKKHVEELTIKQHREIEALKAKYEQDLASVEEKLTQKYELEKQALVDENQKQIKVTKLELAALKSKANSHT